MPGITGNIRTAFPAQGDAGRAIPERQGTAVAAMSPMTVHRVRRALPSPDGRRIVFPMVPAHRAVASMTMTERDGNDATFRTGRTSDTVTARPSRPEGTIPVPTGPSPDRRLDR